MTDLNIQMRSINGESWDNLYPKTKMDLVDGLPEALSAQAAQLADIEYNATTFGAKGDGTTDNTLSIRNLIEAAPEYSTVAFPKGSYAISESIEIDKSLTIVGDKSGSTIKLTSDQSNVISSSSKLIIKDMIIDGNNHINQAAIYTTGELPEIYNASITNARNSNGDDVCAIESTSGSTGRFVAVNTHVENCYRGFRIVGNSDDSTAYLENCSSKDVEISCYFLANHAFSQVVGGDWTGGSQCAPNIYGGGKAVILGGYYHDMLRGPTVGQEVTDFTISGTVSVNMELYGCTADTRLSDGSYVPGYGVISGNHFRNCLNAVRIQADNVQLSNNHSVDHTSETDAAFLIQHSNPVFLSGNTVVGGNGKGFRSNDSRVIVTSPNYVDGVANSLAYGSSDVIEFGKVVSLVGSGTTQLVTDTEMFFGDNATASFNIQLPSTSNLTTKGQRYTFMKIDSTTRSVNVSLPSGQTINGVTGAFQLNRQFESITLVSLGDGNFAVESWNMQTTASTTANRPTTRLYTGRMHFDTTLGKPIWYNGTAWVDATGATV